MTAAPPPFPMIWDGQHFTPPGRFAAVCAEQFKPGEAYLMAEHRERSTVSHRHLFACIRKAWANLPEPWAERLPSEEHVRKYALIKIGLADHCEMVLDTPEAAYKTALFARKIDSYAVIKVTGCVVTVHTAKSQDFASMNGAEFQKSKERILDLLAGILGTSPEELEQNAKEAA